MCKHFGDKVEHGYVDSSSHVIPVNDHAKIPLTIPILQALVVLAEDGGKVFGMFAADIFDAKIGKRWQQTSYSWSIRLI